MLYTFMYLAIISLAVSVQFYLKTKTQLGYPVPPN